jgi:hypothetical protein
MTKILLLKIMLLSLWTNNSYVEQALAHIEALNMVGRWVWHQEHGRLQHQEYQPTNQPTTWYPPEAPTSTPCRMDGWMDGWYVDRKHFLIVFVSHH